MFEELHGNIDFQILNGDWLYEDERADPVEKWLAENKVSPGEIPGIVDLAPTITGVWHNYRIYLERSENLSRWHRNIPAFSPSTTTRY
jgi:alkaline phosphatase D